MKSRTLCYDRATGRMNLRRFLPVWVLYAVGLLVYTVLYMGEDMGYPIVLRDLQYFAPATAFFNFAYAAVAVQLLFGDLYNTRLCYGVHAMPVTRGGWFGTQIILGVCSNLIPNLVVAGLLCGIVPMYRITILWWLLSSELQFLFFFGAAVLCAIGAGNRLGMLLLYGIVNFAQLVVTWLQIHVFGKILYGMDLSNPDLRLCPLLRMSDKTPWICVGKWVRGEEMARAMWFDKNGGPVASFQSSYVVENVELSGHMWELAVYAAVGCLAIALALHLYKKRKLERAGDLLAFPKMEPVILVITTLFAGVVGSIAANIMNRGEYLLLFLGLVVGYFACLMLMKRQVNVFTAKSIAAVGAICAIMLLSIVLTGLDVLGIVYRVPEAEKISKVRLYISTDTSQKVEFTDPEKIAKMLEIQQMALEEHRKVESERPLLERIFGSEEQDIPYTRENGAGEIPALLYITYELENGSFFKRIYHIHESGSYIPTLNEWYSDPKVVFTNRDKCYLDEGDSYDRLLSTVDFVRLTCNHAQPDLDLWSYSHSPKIDEEDWAELLEAILADCREGHMAQSPIFYRGEDSFDLLYFEWRTGKETSRYLYVNLRQDAAHTWDYLISHDYHSEDMTPRTD